MYSVIVAGATGAIGRTVVQEAIKAADVAKVVALTRSTNINREHYTNLFGIVERNINNVTNDNINQLNLHDNKSQMIEVKKEEIDKIIPITFDWEKFTQFWSEHRLNLSTAPKEDFENYKNLFSKHHFVAMCLGTTRKDAGSAANFIRCDYDYVIAFIEALLTFSGPGGFVLPTDKYDCSQQEAKTETKKNSESKNNDNESTDGYIYHIGDGTHGVQISQSKQKNTTSVKETEIKNHFVNSKKENVELKNSQTLKHICTVSAYNANKNGLFLYTKTKGCVDEALQERINTHNDWVKKVISCKQNTTSKGNSENISVNSVIRLTILRPGLLGRHEKSRLVEKLAKIFMKGIPVELCGKCIVNTFIHSKPNTIDNKEDDKKVITNNENITNEPYIKFYYNKDIEQYA